MVGFGRQEGRRRVGYSNTLTGLGGLTGALLVAAVGCGGPQMARPDGFKEEMDKFVAEGRDGRTPDGVEESFKIGPYTIDDVKRNLSGAEGLDMFGDFEAADKSGYRFKLSGGADNKLTGRCARPAPKKSKHLDGSVDVEKETALACSCELEGESVAYTYVEDLAGEYGGQMVASGVQAQITGVYDLDNGERVKGRPAGYRIDDDDGAVAAAGVLAGESSVWIKSSLEEPDRRRMMCILVGLMLWFPGGQKAD